MLPLRGLILHRMLSIQRSIWSIFFTFIHKLSHYSFFCYFFSSHFPPYLYRPLPLYIPPLSLSLAPYYLYLSLSILLPLGPASISDKTSYRKVSWSLEATRLHLELFDPSEIWQAHRQYCCWCACQISKPDGNLNHQSCGFETSRDLTIRRLIRYWNGAQEVVHPSHALKMKL